MKIEQVNKMVDMLAQICKKDENSCFFYYRGDDKGMAAGINLSVGDYGVILDSVITSLNDSSDEEVCKTMGDTKKLIKEFEKFKKESK